MSSANQTGQPGWELPIPISVLADSYKATHFLQYPKSDRFSAYGEFRTPFKEVDPGDTRFVWYGIRYVVEKYLCRRWTHEDVERADKFFDTHNSGFTRFPYPRDLFHRFVEKNDGYFPIRLESLPEGTCANIHTPVFQITAEGEWTPLTTFLETLLTMVWYPVCVATLSRKIRDIVDHSFDRSVDPQDFGQADFRLHDFGFRGCTCVEQSVLGGTAHLLSFRGSDTMSACYYAQFALNGGRPVGCSIPATEHSSMTSWKTERQALENMIDRVGEGAYSCVMDSYDYDHALEVVLPQVAEKKKAKGGFFVVRPDSGDPKEAVLKGLRAIDKIFGARVNSKGFRVPIGAGVIQGDGMTFAAIADVAKAVEASGYSAQSVAYGMGGGLLQRVNRDSMGFATKLSYVRYESGEERNVMKKPHGDWTKSSLPGVLAVKRVNGIPTVFPKSEVAPQDNLLKVVYDMKPVQGAFPETFDQLRERVAKEWCALPRVYDPRSKSLQDLINAWLKQHSLD